MRQRKRAVFHLGLQQSDNDETLDVGLFISPEDQQFLSVLAENAQGEGGMRRVAMRDGSRVFQRPELESSGHLSPRSDD